MLSINKLSGKTVSNSNWCIETDNVMYKMQHISSIKIEAIWSSICVAPQTVEIMSGYRNSLSYNIMIMIMACKHNENNQQLYINRDKCRCSEITMKHTKQDENILIAWRQCPESVLVIWEQNRTYSALLLW